MVSKLFLNRFRRFLTASKTYSDGSEISKKISLITFWAS